MKGQDQNQVSFFPKIFNVQLHLHLVNLLIFVAGLAFGIILTNLKDFSFSPNLSQFSSSSSTLSSPTTQTPNVSQTPPTTTDINIIETEPDDIGLKGCLNPPMIFHDMNDTELLWRASMTHQIREYPFHRVPKVAFMFLTRGPVLLAPFWEKFFKGYQGLFSIYVHSMPSYNASSHPETPVFRGRRIPSQEVEWGKPSQIEAERRLVANALLDISNQRFVQLSESCIPIYNFSTVYSYLIHSGETFVEVYDDPSRVGRGRYNFSDYTSIIRLDQWRKGSQWFEIDRDLAIEVVSDQKYFPVFRKCQGYCFVEEHYLPTFVIIKFPENNANRTLTWADWTWGGPHPTKYTSSNVTVEFLNSLRNGYGERCEYNGRRTDVCFLFARKFPPSALHSLLRIAPKIMHFNE